MSSFKWKGHNIFYTEHGKGDLLLILPGNTASSASHKQDLEYFGQFYRAVSLDFLGTGKSDRINNWESNWESNWWSNGADQAKVLVGILGYKQCLVIGTSGGAAVAMLMGINYPDIVRAVVADSLMMNITQQMFNEVIKKERERKGVDQKKFWELAHGHDWEEVVNKDTSAIEKLVANGGDFFCGRLKEIKCPVLLTASKTDYNNAHSTYQISAQISQSCMYLHCDGNHPLMWSRKEIFRKYSYSFLVGLKNKIILRSLKTD